MQVYENDSVHGAEEQEFGRVNCHVVNMKSCLLHTSKKIVLAADEQVFHSEGRTGCWAVAATERRI